MLRETPALAHAYLVGGCVRDALIGTEGKDFDLEVFGIDSGTLIRALSPWGRTDTVGRSFGVVKLSIPGHTFDFSLPRRDSKTGPGHRGFEVDVDPGLSPREAAARRDFTVNAMMYDPRRGELLDFFGGESDLQNRILRHTSPAFSEDPLRVLRGMQFASRFELTAAPETLELCRSISGTYGELAIERVREEWMKWATKSVLPSAGLRFLRDAGWLEHFPEVAALAGVKQDPEWHPEGDVWTHTLECLDALMTLPEWQAADAAGRAILALAVLAHDFGKPACTQIVERDGRMRIVSPGHEPAGGPIAVSFLERLAIPASLADSVVPLVLNHLAHLTDPTPRAIRRLARRLAPATIRQLAVVMTADAFGRPPRPREIPAGVSGLLAAAGTMKLASSAPRPILLGRHLTSEGWVPGPEFKPVLDAAFEAQLDGVFADLEGALNWLRTRSRG